MAIFVYFAKGVNKAKMWKMTQFWVNLIKKSQSWQIWLVWCNNYYTFFKLFYFTFLNSERGTQQLILYYKSKFQ